MEVALRSARRADGAGICQWAREVQRMRIDHWLQAAQRGPHPTGTHRTRWGVVAGVVLAVAAVGSLAAVVMHLLGPPALMPVDLRVYLAGARAIQSGSRLYGPGFDPGLRLPFTYPPIAAILMVPLSVAGERTLSLLWDAGSLAALAWAMYAVAGRPPGRSRWILAGTALALVTQPVFDNLSLGQVDLFLMAAAVAGSLPREGQAWRGAWVGLAAAVKVVPGLFILYLLLARRWRPAAAAIGTWLALTGIGWALRPTSSVRYFTRLLWNVKRPGSPTSYLNQSLWGMVDRLALGPWHTPVLAALLAALAVWGLSRALWLEHSGHAAAAAVAVGLVGVLASPISWIHEAVWAILALVVLTAAQVPPAAPADRLRLRAAAALALVLAMRLPALGARLAQAGVALPLAGVLQDSVGLVAAVLLLALFRTLHSARPPAPVRAPLPPPPSGRGSHTSL